MSGRTRTGSRRYGRLGLQLIGATLVLLSVGLFLTSWHTIESEQRLLSEQLDARGNALARLGATSCVELLLGSDYPRVETIVVQIARQDPDVVYSRAQKANGQTIREAFGPVEVGRPDVESCRRYEADVVWQPEHGAPQVLGRIELGLSTRSLSELKTQRSRTLALEAGLSFVVLGLVLGWLLRCKVVRPLERLDRDAAALGRGDLESTIGISADNEIGRLAQTLDGMRCNLRASYSEIRASNAELQRVGALREQALQDLARALDAAQAANRAKDEFLATMSHELRTPMNAIIGMTQLLLESPLSEEQRDCADTVHDAAEVLLVIVNDVLDFSRLSAGRIDLDPVPLDPRDLAADVCAMFRRQAEQKGLRLDLEVARDVPAGVRADPLRLRQVLTNLVGNALKFTERGGVCVQIAVRQRSAAQVELEFRVVDTGIGVPESARARLFQPFTQADGSITRRFGGTGLGLVIARRLTELMGGSMGFESAEGRGSTFWFTVHLELAPPVARRESGPRAAAPRAPLPAPRESAAAPAAAGPHVLLVEDNAVNQKVQARMLARLGCRVDLAQDGAEALERCASTRYALVIMDLSMPVLDGLEATRRIRSHEAARGERVPIVALTANALEGDRERCLAAGMDDYLTKPVRSEALAAIIARHAARSAPATQPS